MSRLTDAERAAIEAWFDAGNAPTICPPGAAAGLSPAEERMGATVYGVSGRFNRFDFTKYGRRGGRRGGEAKAAAGRRADVSPGGRVNLRDEGGQN